MSVIDVTTAFAYLVSGKEKVGTASNDFLFFGVSNIPGRQADI
jgi:hypothetical protein